MSLIRVCNVDEEGRFGGPERRIVLVAKALKSLNVYTHVVYPEMDSSKFAQELKKAGIPCSALRITRLSKERKILCKYVLFFLTEVCRLFLFFREHRFDLVHVNGSYQFKVAIAAKLAGIPVVWHFNDTNMTGIVKRVSVVIARFCADGFIVAGKRVRDFYFRGTALDQKSYAEIHAPVDSTMFDPGKVVPDRMMADVQGRKVATVSGINPTKGLEYFIEMASILMQRHDDIIFFVAGAELSSQKKYYKDLKKLIESTIPKKHNLVFLGMVDDIAGFLQAADISVLTSIAEASPTAVWESMSMGKAMVSTDVGSVNEYIENGVSGFVVPIGDTEALASRVELLLNNPELRLEMGRKARLVAQNKLDVSWAARKHASFYKEILWLSGNRQQGGSKASQKADLPTQNYF